ncbi:hypothetical protein Sjap_003942 [Stephania japonica]|uniref:GPI-anchored protein LLG1-like domain-containing protein n=1 Tax=Stephania japonica TaxID=461633 RepID=A0AAP0KPR6_9MAGN
MKRHFRKGEDRLRIRRRRASPGLIEGRKESINGVDDKAVQIWTFVTLLLLFDDERCLLLSSSSSSSSSSISGYVFEATDRGCGTRPPSRSKSYINLYGKYPPGFFASECREGKLGLECPALPPACPVSFEFLNYTIITSQCKGPKYPPNLCCGAFKEFAWPYADQINDVSNDCASTMFSYINLYGKYPPGLFASECREGKLGLECPALSPGQVANDSNHAWILSKTLSSLMLPLAFSLLIIC